MRLKSYNMRNQDGYDGYNCVIVHDNGTEQTVVAYPRQHSGVNSIIKAAFAAVSEISIAEREAKLELAEEIIADIAKEKEMGETAEEHSELMEEFKHVDADAPPVFEEEGLEALNEMELGEGPPDYVLPEGEPDKSWLKGEIQMYLSDKKISYDEKMTKAQLLKIIT